MHEVFESVARYFSVLGEPTRLRILHALCQEEQCVNEIIRVTGLAQANASRHLGLMYQAGMLARRREGTQIFYRVADPVYVELCRTVSAQVMGRAGRVPDARDGFDVPSASPIPLQGLAEATTPRHPPANQKEEASV
ncbi:metalloregulator ArsR/SmtB family transcription factor [Hydrogenophaga sp.]|uniref:ArsR/SmtB family transcription factor n=1 Tax=Hydrogenophaga sp. TaxID=1904254 RepID=UPI00286EAF6A|nr:metalloregulator ArsR/SmtB family transcription factor [Hydrogenophaga sp.]